MPAATCRTCGLTYYRHGVDRRACDSWNPAPVEAPTRGAPIPSDPRAYAIGPGPLRCGIHGQLIEDGRCHLCDCTCGAGDLPAFEHGRTCPEAQRGDAKPMPCPVCGAEDPLGFLSGTACRSCADSGASL